MDEAYRDIWDKGDLWQYKVALEQAVTRAYSVANKPGDDSVISLNIRIALPPAPDSNMLPGIVSSWLFSRKTGDEVEVTGPYG